MIWLEMEHARMEHQAVLDTTKTQPRETVQIVYSYGPCLVAL